MQLSDFHRELYDYLVRHISDTALEDRGQWVMNSDWHQDLRLLGLELLLPVTIVETLFGYPVTVRPDGGVPHLEACVTTAAEDAYHGPA